MEHGDQDKSIRELTIEQVKKRLVQMLGPKIIAGLIGEGMENPTEEDVRGVIDTMYKEHGPMLERMYHEADKELSAAEARERLQKQTDKLSGPSPGSARS